MTIEKIVQVDGTGVNAASLPEAERIMRERYEAIFGTDLAAAAQTPQAQMAGLEAVGAAEFGEALTDLANAISPDHAVGAQQDVLGRLLQIPRMEATHSRVTATLTGVGGVNVPAGSRAKTTDGDEFTTLADAVLSPTGVSVEMQAVETGPIAAAAGTLTQIVTVIAGWETITNTESAVQGRDAENDFDYLSRRFRRTAITSTGPLAALNSALDAALAGRKQTRDNSTDTLTTVQELAIRPHHILVIAESGTIGDITRAVESHRGMGVGTMTAIRGGAHSVLGTLQAITNGTVNYGGMDYTGLNLSAASDLDGVATALNALLAMATPRVTIAHINGVFYAQYGWQPSGDPAFGAGTTETALGLNPAAATAAPGPFIRPFERELTIAMTVTRMGAFPADGLDRIRTAIQNVVAGYEVGEQAWLNDFLSAAEGVGGTRVSGLTVQAGSANVSGVDVALDNLYTLPAANLTITIS